MQATRGQPITSGHLRPVVPAKLRSRHPFWFPSVQEWKAPAMVSLGCGAVPKNDIKPPNERSADLR